MLKKTPADEQFLTLLFPIFEYAQKKLEVFLSVSLESKHLLSKNFITKTVFHALAPIYKAIIARVCATEMFSASQRNLLKGKTPNARFKYFIKALEDPENSAAILEKYPIMEQLLNKALQQFLSFAQEFFQRYFNDYHLLQVEFFKQQPLRLHDLTITGDRHNQGHAVIVLKAKYKKIIVQFLYKPRSLMIDQAFQSFIDWLNRKNPQLDLYKFKILDRGRYGWCEFVPHEPCHNEQQLKNFYQRSGALLAVLYTLIGIDIHQENIIASGEYPVVVDLECLLTPYFLANNRAEKIAARHFVSQILFLPTRTMVTANYTGIDISALGGMGGETTPFTVMQWENPGTDQMRILRKTTVLKKSKNQPFLKGKIIQASHYRSHLIEGFQNTYQTILKNKNYLISPQSPFFHFRSVTNRILFRNTNDYSKLLVESFHPELLFDRNKRQQHFAWIHEIITFYPNYKFLISSELDDLQTLNIPYFYSYTDRRQILNSHDKPVAMPVLLSGWERLLHHVKEVMSTDDLTLQKTLINYSFNATELNQKPKKIMVKKPDFINTNEEQKIDRNNALNLAKKILDDLAQQKIINRNIIAWPTLDFSFEHTWVSSFTDIDLYNGLMGIGLTFAYAGKIFQDRNYESIAKECLTSLRQLLKENGVKNFKNIGGYTGLGGVIYALMNLYKLWNDDSLTKDIELLLSYLPTLITDDKHLDVVNGSAGCLAVLIELSVLLPKLPVKPLMENLVEKILTVYPEPEKFAAFQETFSEQPLLGFSHGLAGFIWVLDKYNQLDSKPKIIEWIKSALNYERQHFNKKQSNWPDFRKNIFRSHHAGHIFISAWCHGAPGIGLSRLDLSKEWQDQPLGDEIKAALDNIKTHGFNGDPILCHGDLGNLELLFQISEIYPILFNKNQFAAYFNLILKNLSKNINQSKTSSNMVGLMSGKAGVPYQLMHFTLPEIVPNILLLKI